MTPQETYRKDFEKTFRSLCASASAWQVWNDFVDLTAIAISNSTDPLDSRREAREAVYRQIMGKYTEKQAGAFPALFQIVVDALDREPRQDFLGELFMGLELGSNWHGQFFTPYHICELMAQVNTPEPVDGVTTVFDPACGAGALLIAARNVLAFEKNVGWDHAFFVAQDISHTAGMMCYIQLSMLGCAGYVCIGDSLENPVRSRTSLYVPDRAEGQDIWHMPMYWMEPWQIRVFGELVKR